MRPVRRGRSPRSTDFDPYDEAKPDLASRLGRYCSYCERKIETSLAVEHIQPKHPAATRHPVGAWSNFLLACVNCNSTKGEKPVDLHDLLLPDRDNTFAAIRYLPDGTLAPSKLADRTGLNGAVRDTLALTGLDQPSRQTRDTQGNLVAFDRAQQRVEAWITAEDARADLTTTADPSALRKMIVRLAQSTGFFSVWMTVFEGDPTTRQALINAWPGTAESGCFDAATAPVSPAPNPDALAGGGKI